MFLWVSVCKALVYITLCWGLILFAACHPMGLEVVFVAGQARWELVGCLLVTNVVTLGGNYMQNKPLNCASTHAELIVGVKRWRNSEEIRKRKACFSWKWFHFIGNTFILFALTIDHIYNIPRKRLAKILLFFLIRYCCHFDSLLFKSVSF